MTRWIPMTTLVVLALGAAGLVAQEASSRPPTPPAEESEESATAQTTAEQEAPAEPSPKTEAEHPANGADGELEDQPGSSPAPRRQVSFDFMPDGRPVPPLPGNAPNRVKLGVALFRYQGVQGAGTTTRSRAEAQALAEKAVALPTFKEAIAAGDPGSSINVGWISRGVLERSVEYAVFSLDKGETAQSPIDTPRGFWVVQRVR